ncbi:prostate stem cell antigen [Pocillopora verrucosa]|uniref:prostate stem cell antigen n=1 Tax=Pocillopora verrucosa TaxID=203993 RepID=UPI00333FC3CA
MATAFLFISATFLVLFIIPAALSLQCYECSSLAQVSGGTSCSADNVKKVTCPPIYDRCVTMKFSMTPEVTVEMRNCSSSLVCDAQSDFNPCKIYKAQGKDCSIECCQGDLCNSVGPTEPPSKPSSAVLGPTLSLGALLFALLLPKIF